MQFALDIVFIKLGTNDSKLQNRGYLDTDFEEDYKDLIASFKKKNMDVRTVFLLPAPFFLGDSTSIWNPIVKEKIIPLAQKVTYDTQNEVIDLYRLFVDRPDVLPDGIHPKFGSFTDCTTFVEAVVRTAIRCGQNTLMKKLRH